MDGSRGREILDIGAGGRHASSHVAGPFLACMQKFAGPFLACMQKLPTLTCLLTSLASSRDNRLSAEKKSRPLQSASRRLLRGCRPALFLPLRRCSASHSAAPPHRLHRRCALSSACSASPSLLVATAEAPRTLCAAQRRPPRHGAMVRRPTPVAAATPEPLLSPGAASSRRSACAR